MIGAAVAVDRIRNLLPLDLRQTLVAGQRLVEAGIDAIEVSHDELGQQINLHNR